jgi:hypothetical protein
MARLEVADPEVTRPQGSPLRRRVTTVEDDSEGGGGRLGMEKPQSA